MRRYAEEDVRRLRFIRAAQAAGFLLGEIAELIKLNASSDRERARELARARLCELERRISDLQAAKAWLGELERECAKKIAGPCPIIEAFT